MASHTDIDAQELHALLSSQQAILVDVRNDDEVARGVIEGAMHLPMMVIPGMGNLLCEHAETALVFYCHSGIRSAQAAAFIAGNLERENVYNLRGGILAWANAGYTLCTKNGLIMEFHQELDARGLKCPLPILRCKKALADVAAGEILKITATDPGSVKDFQAFCKQTGHEMLTMTENVDAPQKEFIFHIKKRAA